MAGRLVWRGLAAGLVAGAAATALDFLLVPLGVPSFAELGTKTAIAYLPTPLFIVFIDRLGTGAKPLLFLTMLAVQLAAGGLLGIVYARWFAGGPGRVKKALALVAILWLLTLAVFMPLTGGGFFGKDTRGGPAVASATMLAVYLLYAVLVAVVYQTLSAPARAAATDESGPPSLERRRLLVRLGWAVVGLAMGGATLLLAAAQGIRLTGWTPSKARPNELTSEVTSNEDFYQVSIDVASPVVDARTWTLTVMGLVERPLTLTLDDLKALPSVEQYATLECISNGLGGPLMGNALWKGVVLKDILDRAGVKPGVVDVVLRAADTYSDSIPIAKALQPEVVLAYEMNGVPLPKDHGFPARLLTPGIYGMKNVKWLTKIELVDHDYKGYWEEQDWSDEAIVETRSRIDLPPERTTIFLPAQNTTVGGVAFSGDRGIARVEVSFDGGKTWHDAQVKEALSPYSWVLWWGDWDPPGLGSYDIMARATDKTGKVQLATRTESFPSGATGLHTITVRVA